MCSDRERVVFAWNWPLPVHYLSLLTEAHCFFLMRWRLHAELTKNNWPYSQLSYKLERNIVE